MVRTAHFIHKPDFANTLLNQLALCVVKTSDKSVFAALDVNTGPARDRDVSGGRQIFPGIVQAGYRAPVQIDADTSFGFVQET